MLVQEKTSRMDELKTLVDGHKFWRNGFRINLDTDETHRRKDKNGRVWLKYAYAPRSNTVREGPILECVQNMLPHVNAVCLNKKAASSPPMMRHKDRKNEGTSHICFWGDFEGGGELCLADGRVFSEKHKWHEYDGSEIEHWVQPHASGMRFSAVAYRGPPAPKTRPPAKKKYAPKE